MVAFNFQLLSSLVVQRQRFSHQKVTIKYALCFYISDTKRVYTYFDYLLWHHKLQLTIIISILGGCLKPSWSPVVAVWTDIEHKSIWNSTHIAHLKAYNLHYIYRIPTTKSKKLSVDPCDQIVSGHRSGKDFKNLRLWISPGLEQSQLFWNRVLVGTALNLSGVGHLVKLGIGARKAFSKKARENKLITFKECWIMMLNE